MYANVKTGICIEFDTEIMFSPEYKTLVVPSHEQERCEFPPILYTSIRSEDIFNSITYYLYRNESDTDAICDSIKLKEVKF